MLSRPSQKTAATSALQKVTTQAPAMSASGECGATVATSVSNEPPANRPAARIIAFR